MLSRRVVALVLAVLAVLVAAEVFLQSFALRGIGLGLAIMVATWYFATVLARIAADARATRREARQLASLPALVAMLPLRRPLPATGNYAASSDTALLLAQLAREIKPRSVLELGSGVSTLVLGYALEAYGGGALLSIEHGEGYAAEVAERLRMHGLAGRVQERLACLEPAEVDGRRYQWYARDAWAAVPDGSVDMLVVDGPPQALQPLSRYPALPLLAPKLRPGAVIVLDDCGDTRTRRVLDAWLERFPGVTAERYSWLETQPAVLRWSRPA
jgi:predicted O-methyltransferase YrrM